MEFPDLNDYFRHLVGELQSPIDEMPFRNFRNLHILKRQECRESRESKRFVYSLCTKSCFRWVTIGVATVV
jgi:hypothetical protein